MKNRKPIVVIGSLNMDVVNRVAEHPAPGETVKGKGTFHYYGGKGSNQAAAAALAGGRVAMIGAVGSDEFGSRLVGQLKKLGIAADNIVVKNGQTGTAYITVSDAGENSIILLEGANGLLQAEDIPFDRMEWSSAVVLLQNEIPAQTTLAAIELCHARGAAVWLNPAPAAIFPDQYLQLVDTLILNESEAGLLLGGAYSEPYDAVRRLARNGVNNVILTLGSQGVMMYTSEDEYLQLTAYPVKAVDTTAAGDTFIGAFAAAIQDGKPKEEALRFASAAAAISVTRPGAQPSIPSRQEILQFLEERRGLETTAEAVEKKRRGTHDRT